MVAKVYICDAPKGKQAWAVPDCAGDVVVNDFTFDLAKFGSPTLAVGDLIDLGILGAFSTVSDAILIADDLDTGTPAIAFDVGIMSGTPGVDDNTRTVGAELFSGSTLAQAGGVARPTLATAFQIAKTDNHRSIGLKVTAAAATQTTTGKITLRVFSHQP